MPSYRPERVAELIHRELGQRLRTEVKDPRVTPISITQVVVTRDLGRAVISYLPLGGGEPSDELQDGLEVAAKQLRGPIGRALRLRHAPELVFEVDGHTEDAIRVTQLIDSLTRQRREQGEEE
ncbi:MAG: 30S ribosome-binding factor RbfA [Myxococcales bacterium]|nr:30S ribosome-binding factor RbfA [Myxococcales bacterium]